MAHVELRDAIAVQYKHRIFLFGPLEILSGLRPLLCRPSHKNIHRDDVQQWAFRRGFNVVSVQSFIAMKPPMQAYCDVVADQADEIDALRGNIAEFQGLAKNYDATPRGETIIDG